MGDCRCLFADCCDVFASSESCTAFVEFSDCIRCVTCLGNAKYSGGFVDSSKVGSDSSVSL